MFVIGQRVITIESSVGDYFPDFAKLAKQKAIEEDCLVAFEFNGLWIYLSASSDLDLAWRDFQRVGIGTDAPAPTTRERIDAVLATLATMQVELAAIQATLTPE